MTAALLFLRKYWAPIAVVLLLLGVYLYWNGLQNTIATQKQEISRLEGDNRILKDNNDKLELAISTNNKAISALAEGADKTKQDFATLNSTVGSQIAALAPRLDAIKKGQKPQTCPDTMRYLLDARKDFQ